MAGAARPPERAAAVPRWPRRRHRPPSAPANLGPVERALIPVPATPLAGLHRGAGRPCGRQPRYRSFPRVVPHVVGALVGESGHRPPSEASADSRSNSTAMVMLANTSNPAPSADHHRATALAKPLSAARSAAPGSAGRPGKTVGGGSAWAWSAGIRVGVVVPGLYGLGAGSGVVLGQGAQRPVPGDFLQHG